MSPCMSFKGEVACHCVGVCVCVCVCVYGVGGGGGSPSNFWSDFKEG